MQLAGSKCFLSLRKRVTREVTRLMSFRRCCCYKFATTTTVSGGLAKATAAPVVKARV